ncbi:YitT family protein [Abyssicoccus albus]|uniref:YitT family protein n=1 Tax=Abyssicoccus albus TaxID=1817405 RepID=UPI00097E1C54|nr:YitT family protein [Abyssicoccus albus]AQL56710.1 hypothetical protein BVH56_07160 [Abyssicoccus albus]
MKQSKWWDYLLVIVGAIIVGVTYNAFLLPAKLAAGGLSGITTILYELFKFDPATVQYLVNIPLFILGLIFLGKDFTLKSIIGTFIVPTAIFFSKGIVPHGVTDPLLSSIYGGIVLGLGLGLVYRGNGSTGGTVTIAQLLRKFTGISSGFSQLLVDAIVVITSALVFSFELALYALIAIYVTSKVIDFAQLQTGDNKMVFIITQNKSDVINVLHESVDRGVTEINALGGYSGEQRSLLLSVMETKEAIFFKQVMQREQPNSFVIFINTSEILGRGFSKGKYDIES